MSWWSKTVENVGNLFSGNKDRDNEINKLRDQQSKLKYKDASELQAEGSALAGQAAANKAGIASKKAKASAMMNSGNRLQASNAAASAAQEASTNGYDENAAHYTSLAQQQNKAEVDKQYQDYGNKISDIQAKQKRHDDNRANTMALAGQIFKGTASDKDKKITKHTYIPVEKRVNKGK